MRFLVQYRHWCLSLLLALFTVASIAGYAWMQARHFRHLCTVKQGVMYRSGQLTRKGLERVLYENNIGTLINLRSPDSHKTDKSDSWEEDLCFKSFVRFVSIPFRPTERKNTYSLSESNQFIEQAVERFLEVLADPVTYPRPILVHCLAGVHRTGLMVALYRIEHDGWSKQQAIAEMRQRGYFAFVPEDALCQFIVNWTPMRDRTTLHSQIK